MKSTAGVTVQGRRNGGAIGDFLLHLTTYDYINGSWLSAGRFILKATYGDNPKISVTQNLAMLGVVHGLDFRENNPRASIDVSVDRVKYSYIAVRSTTSNLEEILVVQNRIKNCLLGFKNGLYTNVFIESRNSRLFVSCNSENNVE